MGNNLLSETERKEGATAKVSQLRRRQGSHEPQPEINWELMSLLLLQMQEHLEALSAQTGFNTVGRRALKGLRDCADQLLPALIEQAKRPRQT